MEKKDWNPETNDRVIAITREDDGNYKGYMQRNGKFIETRQGDPNTVLNTLLTTE